MYVHSRCACKLQGRVVLLLGFQSDENNVTTIQTGFIVFKYMNTINNLVSNRWQYIACLYVKNTKRSTRIYPYSKYIIWYEKKHQKYPEFCGQISQLDVRGINNHLVWTIPADKVELGTWTRQMCNHSIYLWFFKSEQIYSWVSAAASWACFWFFIFSSSSSRLCSWVSFSFSVKTQKKFSDSAGKWKQTPYSHTYNICAERRVCGDAYQLPTAGSLYSQHSLIHLGVSLESE